MKESSGAIRLDSIGVGRPGEDRRLSGITCTLQPGRVTLLIGANGSGKSTLLDVLGGLIVPDEGQVQFVAADERESRDRGEYERPAEGGLRGLKTAGVGMVFQFPEQQLFARTVKGEFDYSLRPLRVSKREAERRTAEALREVGLDGGALSLHPFGLSGGEQRRVAVASTLATEPAWLLLDEASAGQDAEGLRRMAAQLRRWSRQEGRGVVLATHDLAAFLPLADEVLVLVRGRLAAAMSREALLAAPAVLRQAGLALPDSVRAAAWLRARGLAA
ncbi:ATP-binding cassette domain-containing protein, partial [Paenibacillus koleovorans]|uniref:ATP-binding cassette domain-containing protein n=1 Tax=Paenibacillus koleovorans TaxID=121608 RepID=UPI000FD79B1D